MSIMIEGGGRGPRWGSEVDKIAVVDTEKLLCGGGRVLARTSSARARNGIRRFRRLAESLRADRPGFPWRNFEVTGEVKP